MTLKKIKSTLNRHGFEIDLDEEWEVHGPHLGMNYQVYVGWAYQEPYKGCKMYLPK